VQELRCHNDNSYSSNWLLQDSSRQKYADSSRSIRLRDIAANLNNDLTATQGLRSTALRSR